MNERSPVMIDDELSPLGQEAKWLWHVSTRSDLISKLSFIMTSLSERCVMLKVVGQLLETTAHCIAKEESVWIYS